MTGAGLLGLLLLKHGLLAHVIDFGYSAARRHNYRFWYVALVMHCLAETVGTLFILSHFPLSVVSVVLLIEFAGAATTAVLEREAPLQRMLIYHLLCEVTMFMLYVLMTSLLVWK